MHLLTQMFIIINNKTSKKCLINAKYIYSPKSIVIFHIFSKQFFTILIDIARPASIPNDRVYSPAGGELGPSSTYAAAAGRM